MTAIYWNIRNRHFGKYFHGIEIKDTSGTKGNKVTLGAIVIQVKLETVNKRLKQREIYISNIIVQICKFVVL